jgi:hypothetical protein
MRSSSARTSARPRTGSKWPTSSKLRLEVAQEVDRLDVAERVAMAVAANRDEVREVPEERAEDVARERDPPVRQPEDERVVGFGARDGERLEADAAERECDRSATRIVGCGRDWTARRRAGRRPPCGRCSP